MEHGIVNALADKAIESRDRYFESLNWSQEVDKQMLVGAKIAQGLEPKGRC